MRTLLFILVAFVALTASVSGALLITNSDGSLFKIPVTLVHPTPFIDFLIPGIILTAVVGGTNIVALSHFFQKDKFMYNWALTGGAVLTAWILVPMILVQTISWLQILFLCIGILMILLSFQLKRKWLV